MSPTSWPDSSTVATCTMPVSSVSCDSWKLVETSLTTESGGAVVLWLEPLMRTLHLAGSHDGGETS